MNWILTGIFLGICSLMDLRDRKINLLFCIIFIIISIFYVNICKDSKIIFDIMPGIFMFGLGIISEKYIGLGDGIMVFVMGLLLNLSILLNILFCSFVLVILYWLIRKIVTRVRTDNPTINEIPAAPFFFVGELITFYLM